MSRHSFSKNLKNIDAKVLTVENAIGNIRSNLVSTNSLIVPNISIDAINFNTSNKEINFNNRKVNNIAIVGGSINNVSIGNTSATLRSLNVDGNVILGINPNSSFELPGSNNQIIRFQKSSNIFSCSNGISFEIGNIRLNNNTIEPRLLGGTIQFNGIMDFTNASVNGITGNQIQSPLNIDNLIMKGNGISTTSGDLNINSNGGNVFLNGNVVISSGSLNNIAIGNTLPSTGNFTTMNITSATIDNLFVNNEIQYNFDSVMIIKNASVNSLKIRDTSLFSYLQFDTSNKKVIFPGNVSVQGNLNANIKVSGIIQSSELKLESTNSRVLIESGGSESSIGTDAIHINSTNISGGIRLDSNNGILINEKGKNINLLSNRDINITSSSQCNFTSSSDFIIHSQNINISASGAMTLLSNSDISVNNKLNLNSNSIENVSDPVLLQDAATKHYVDSNVGSFITITDETALGINALSSLNSANNSTAVGYNALNSLTGGNYNIAFGEKAATNLINGTNNIIIGSGSQTSSSDSSYQFVIGHNSKATTNNELFIDNNINQIRMNGLNTHTSSDRINLIAQNMLDNRLKKVNVLQVFATNSDAKVSGLIDGDIYRKSNGNISMVFT